MHPEPRFRFDSRARQPHRLLPIVTLTVLATLVLAAAPAGSGTGGPIVQSRSEPADDTCTIASVERRATIGVQVVHATDFCELLSQALASSVFRARLFVTPGVLWHYAGSVSSCQLRFGRTRNRMVVRNSVHTCRWFARPASGWQTEAAAVAAADVTHA